jgi:hypothetical protein
MLGGRIVVLGALAAAVFHVFRRDIVRFARALRQPAETFVADVKRELSTTAASGGEAGAATGSAAKLPPPPPPPATGAAPHSPAPPPPPPPPLS